MSSVASVASSFAPAQRAATHGPHWRPLALTARDLTVFAELYRHRVVSSSWLARAHFGGSQEAAWERLRRLRTAGYVERLRTTQGLPQGYRLTTKGRQELGLETRARRREPGVGATQTLHAMTVAELAVHTMGSIAPHDPTAFGFAWVTEQELLDGAGVDWLPTGKLGRPGFLPDGVIEATTLATGEVERLAVEVELHRKGVPAYAKKLAWYKKLLEGEAAPLSQLRYYVADTTISTTVRRALRAAGVADDDDSVLVKRFTAAIPIYGRRGPLAVTEPVHLAAPAVPPAPAPEPAPVPTAAPVIAAPPPPVAPRPVPVAPQPLAERLKTWLTRPVTG